MRGRIVVFALLALMWAASFPRPRCLAGEKPPHVAASIHPVAARLAGDDFGAGALFGPGIHPRQAGAEKSSLPERLELYVRVGGPFEGASDNREKGAAVRVLDPLRSTVPSSRHCQRSCEPQSPQKERSTGAG